MSQLLIRRLYVACILACVFPEGSDENAVGAFRFDCARRAFAQTSLVVDPANGQMPAYTPESFARAMPRGTYGNGPLDWATDFSTYERCITRGVLGSTLNVIYGNGAG